MKSRHRQQCLRAIFLPLKIPIFTPIISLTITGMQIFTSPFMRLAKRLVFTCFLLVNAAAYAQTTNSFAASTPEAEGIAAAAIDSFLNAVQGKHEFHSFMMLRHGKVVAQGWWNPYQPKLRHSLYSCSKSFTSTAIGFAVSEKRFSVNDKVVSFFPGSLPDTISPYLAALTVKDLLTMSVGQPTDPTGPVVSTKDDWVKAFLALPIAYKPGSQFLYNSMATFMLSAIVQKVTGQKEVDYLTPRLFSPLGISGMDWEINKQGINTGGWGLRVETEALAKMGQLYLQKGKWQGKQVIPEAWVTVMPDQDAVIAITSETSDMQGELNLVWKYLLPAMQPKALPANAAADDKLFKHLAALSLPPAPGAINSTNGTFNKTYTVKSNVLNIRSIAFSSTNGVCRVILKKDSATYTLNFANGKWLAGQTDMQGPGLVTAAREDFSILVPYKVVGSYGWNDSRDLQLKLRYIESPHTETITCHFNGKELNADVEYSFNYGKNKVVLHGETVE
jgi:CubicO group peptidase (beta-lactamase class C family)